MKKISFLLGALLVSLPVAQANVSTTSVVEQAPHKHYKLSGKVIDASTQKPLPYVVVRVVGSSDGASAKKDGTFVMEELHRPQGKLRIVLMGYKTQEFDYDVTKKSEIILALEPSVFNIDEVVVSANRTETKRRQAPVLVNVTDAKLFEATASVNLDQALKFNPGVRVEDNCQNCGFNQVRINGLDGPYSQVVINSRSIFSSLAGVYGLEMFPTEMIDRVEVVRGGGSAIFGSSAIGGTINIITKAPSRNMTTVSYNTELYQDNWTKPMHNANFFSSVVSPDLQSGISVYGRMKERDGIDVVRPGSLVKADKDLGTKDGQDGYSELPKLKSVTVGTSVFLNPWHQGKLSLDYFYTQEDRRGGNNLEKPEHEANIAESLKHNIHTGILRLDQYVADGAGFITAFGAVSHTLRRSYYGGGPVTPDNLVGSNPISPEDAAKGLGAYGLTKDLTAQMGLQYVHNFQKLLFMPSMLTVGGEYAYNRLNDSSGNRPLAIGQHTRTSSLFAQNEWKNDKLGFLLGLRYDHVGLSTDEKHAKLGLSSLDILTPRATLRYNPTEDINIRLSYAEGFRAPAYFEEELHVAFANGEGKPRILSPDLREERSKSFTGSVDYYTTLSDNISLNLMLEGFYTRIFNKFVAVEKDDYTYVQNVDEDGHKVNASVYGANFEMRLAYKKLTSLQLGYTVQRSLFDRPQRAIEDVDKKKEFMRTPNQYGYFVWSLTPTDRFSFNLTGDFTGSMYVPHEHGDKEGVYITNDGENKIVFTSPFFALNTKVAYKFAFGSTDMEVNFGINNLLNAYQKDFDEGPNRASAYVYGPKSPRSIFAGIKLSL